MLPNILQGPSLLIHKSFLILGNAARCAPLKIPQIASEDDFRVLFFHNVLSTVRAEDSQKMMEDMLAKYELMKSKLDSTKAGRLIHF